MNYSSNIGKVILINEFIRVITILFSLIIVLPSLLHCLAFYWFASAVYINMQILICVFDYGVFIYRHMRRE